MPLPNEIQSGRLNSILHKMLGITEGAPAPSLAPDMFSCIVLENDRPEYKFLAGERLCIGNQSLAAGGAGLYSSVQLWNPAGSNILVVTDWLASLSSANKTFNIRTLLVDPSGTGSTALAFRGMRDLRWGASATNQPTGMLYSLATATPGGFPITKYYFEADSPALLPLVFVLSPGSGIIISDNTANAAIDVSLSWRERVLEKGELR